MSTNPNGSVAQAASIIQHYVTLALEGREVKVSGDVALELNEAFATLADIERRLAGIEDHLRQIGDQNP